VVVNPLAQGFIHTGDSADNRPSFPGVLVYFWEKVEVWELYVTGSLYDSLTVTVAAKRSREEGFAFGVDVECIDHGAEDTTIVTFVVLKSFFRGDLLIVVCVQEVIIQGAPKVQRGFHNGGP
jgi:hypothetical protein